MLHSSFVSAEVGRRRTACGCLEKHEPAWRELARTADADDVPVNDAAERPRRISIEGVQ